VKLTPEQRKAAVVVSLRLGLAIENAGASERAIAGTLGRSHTRLNEWCDPDRPKTISARDLEVLRRRHPAVWREYRRMEREEADNEALPGLEDEDHEQRLMRAVLEVTTADGNARTKALRRLLGFTTAALRDATGEDE
jgi:hypothetical protein